MVRLINFLKWYFKPDITFLELNIKALEEKAHLILIPYFYFSEQNEDFMNDIFSVRVKYKL